MLRGDVTAESAEARAAESSPVAFLPDRRSAVDYGPYSAYCKVCWGPVYALWVDSVPPPATCVHGMSLASDCPDALGRAKLARDIAAIKR